jgi:hypothetical protein
VAYGERHVAAGLPSQLRGARLIPVQALESALVGVLVIAGIAVSEAGHGRAFGLYVMGYAVLRYVLEELRGDVARRYWRGVSEAQWTSLLIACASAGAAVVGVLPFAVAHVAVASAMVVAAAWRASGQADGLLRASHLLEVATAVARSGGNGSGVGAITVTSQGLHVSGGCGSGTHHYTLSRPGTAFAFADATRMACVIVALRHRGADVRVLEGARGVHHVLID